MWSWQPALNVSFIICHKRMIILYGMALGLNEAESLDVVLDSSFAHILHLIS